jgi:hypothetical protein
MPERLFWTAIPTSWRKAFLGNSVTFDSPDNYLPFTEPKYDSLQYLQESEPAASTRRPSPVFNSHRPCWSTIYALTSYSGGARFDSRPGNPLLRLRFS